jgi:hypothetical protein
MGQSSVPRQNAGSSKNPQNRHGRRSGRRHRDRYALDSGERPTTPDALRNCGPEVAVPGVLLAKDAGGPDHMVTVGVAFDGCFSDDEFLRHTGDSELLDSHWASRDPFVSPAPLLPSELPPEVSFEENLNQNEKAAVSPEHQLRKELSEFTGAVRSEIRTAVTELSAAQSSASRSQGEVLRTLTEAIVASSGSSPLQRHDVESLLFSLETRLKEDFRQTLLENLKSLPRTDATGPVSASPESGESTSHKTSTAERNRPVIRSASLPDRTWDEIRRDLMNGSDQPAGSPNGPEKTGDTSRSATTARTVSASADRVRSGEETSVTSPAAECEELEGIPEFTMAVDLNSLSESQLREALQNRESLISSLISRLRRKTSGSGECLTIEQLRMLGSELPAELSARVTRTLQQVDEQLRLGELELSLERARVARLASQLDLSRLQVERNARQVGLTLNPDGSIATSNNPAGRNTGSRRWLGKLGFGE